MLLSFPLWKRTQALGMQVTSGSLIVVADTLQTNYSDSALVFCKVAVKRSEKTLEQYVVVP